LKIARHKASQLESQSVDGFRRRGRSCRDTGMTHCYCLGRGTKAPKAINHLQADEFLFPQKNKMDSSCV
jgi:hypothetical protein